MAAQQLTFGFLIISEEVLKTFGADALKAIHGATAKIFVMTKAGEMREI